MKNLLIIVLLSSVICTNGFAQLQQGKKFVGGTLSFYKFDNDNSANTTNLEIGPSLGFMVSDHLSLGVLLDYTGQYVKGGNFKPNQSIFTLGAFSRQYFPVGEQFALYVQESLSGSTGTEKDTDNGLEQKFNITGFSIGVGPGIIFFPDPKLGLEAGIGLLGYDHQKRKNSDTGSSNSSNSYGLNFNMTSITFGLRYYF